MNTRTELFNLAKFLINHGAKINSKNNLLETPLSIILNLGYILGVEGNPNPNVVNNIINDIIFENIEDIVKLLINHGANVNIRNSYDDFPLQDAILMGFKNIVKLLIDHGAKVNMKDRYGNTCMHEAVGVDSTEIVKLLIDHGANINAINDEGLTPLIMAIMNNKPNVVKYFIKVGAVGNLLDLFCEIKKRNFIKGDSCIQHMFPSELGGWMISKPPLGTGGCAFVFKVKRGTTVAAMKVVRKMEKLKKKEYDVNEALLANEATQLNRMQKHGTNPYLPHLFQGFTTEDVWSFFVMEYFQRGSLEDFVKRNGSPDQTCVFGIGLRLVKCLQQMHEVGVGWLHLDVKPENVMITDDPKRGVCLVDFGLTVPISYVQLSPRKELEGSYHFMGFHVWDLERQSFRDDLEAVGLTLAYVLLGGTLPWMKLPKSEIRRQIQAIDMPDILADICKAPVLATYLKEVRALGVDEKPDYQRLVTLLADEAGECFYALNWRVKSRMKRSSPKAETFIRRSPKLK